MSRGYINYEKWLMLLLAVGLILLFSAWKRQKTSPSFHTKCIGGEVYLEDGEMRRKLIDQYGNSIICVWQ